MARRSLSAIAVLVLGLAFGAAAVPAQEQEGDAARRAHRLAQDLMSPFCPGRTLADCPSPEAAAVREQTRSLLDAGFSEQEIRALLSERYGDELVGVPRSALGWSLPALALLAGAAALVAFLRRGSRSRSALSEGEAPDELRRELERELRERGL